MRLKMYSVRDTKAEIYHAPWYKNTHGEAEREFQTIADDPKSTIYKHPEDYDLYFVGEYDDQTGKIEACVTPQHIQKASHVQTKTGLNAVQ